MKPLFSRDKFVPCLLCLSVLIAPAARAFDLFDPSRGQEKAPAPPSAPPIEAPPPPPPPKPQAPPPPQKDFMLEGTSRIGARHTALLQTPDGKHISQRLQGDQPVPIKGYEDYKLLLVAPRKAQIAYPDSSPCKTSNSQRGVQCSTDGKSATLSLQAGKPLPEQASPFASIPQPPMLSSPDQPLPPGQPGAAPNPAIQKFQAELQRRQAELQAQQAAGGLAPGAPQPPPFQPQRIRDEDVPPGMRVIRTPFGDRLIPSGN